MEISSFDQLLQAARQQPQPQRLLFVFTAIELPEDSTTEQKERFQAGQGGALVPLMYADKLPQEVTSFNGLVAESQLTGKAWGMVFAAAMQGNAGLAPTSEEAEVLLQKMVESIKIGEHHNYIPFDRDGQPVNFD